MSRSTILLLDLYGYTASQGYLDRETHQSISLVSRSFRDAAQRQIFQKVAFRYRSRLEYYTVNDSYANLQTFQERIRSICRSHRLCSFIKELQVIFCSAIAQGDIDHTNSSDPVFMTMMVMLAGALPAMTILRRISYSAPFMPGDLHQVLLIHPSLSSLVVTPITCCETPCADATVQHPRNHALQKLEIADWSSLPSIHGLTSPSIGARRCTLASFMFLTHSRSLRSLRVPILLLYDAVSANAQLPDFPHLHSLSITPISPLLDLENIDILNPIIQSIERFLLQVHETLLFFDWRAYMPFDILARLPPSWFPKLETLEGEGIECLLRKTSLKSLRLVAPPGAVSVEQMEAEKPSIYALHRYQSRNQRLSTLSLQGFLPCDEIVSAISSLESITELTLGLKFPVELDGEVPLPTRLVWQLSQFLGAFIPKLPNLRIFSLDVSYTRSSESTPLDHLIRLANFLKCDTLERIYYRRALDKPDAPLLYKRSFESVVLERTLTETGEYQWIAPQEVEISAGYTSCQVHQEKCRLNHPLHSYKSWMKI